MIPYMSSLNCLVRLINLQFYHQSYCLPFFIILTFDSFFHSTQIIFLKIVDTRCPVAELPNQICGVCTVELTPSTTATEKADTCFPFPVSRGIPCELD